MLKNDLLKNDGEIIRIITIKNNQALVIDCIKRNMPYWINIELLESYIPFIDNPNDTYGNGIAIGGGGTVIIGGGESSDFCKNNYISDGGNERLILANDGMIDFYVNCQDGSTSKAVHTYIDTNGKYVGVSQKATQLETNRYIFGKLFNGTSDVAGQAMVYGWYNSNAENRFASGGLQIRENNCVQNKQSDIAYAPSIGFHWSNRIAATLLFHSDGIFYFRKQNFTDRATIDANLNAGSIATTTASGIHYFFLDSRYFFNACLIFSFCSSDITLFGLFGSGIAPGFIFTHLRGNFTQILPSLFSFKYLNSSFLSV